MPPANSFSRHYYDLAMLLDTDDGKIAATDFDLFVQAAKHKTTFFRSGWANYDITRPGTPQLLLRETRIKDLRADYRAMTSMILMKILYHLMTYLRRLRRFKKQ
ncbi:hypothetical protein [Azospirillum palustre]